MSAKHGKSIRAQFAAHGLDIRSVGGAAREIKRLNDELRAGWDMLLAAKRDSFRMDWLEANAHYELRLRAGPSVAEVARWWTRYVSFHSFTGTTIREAVDQARNDFPVVSAPQRVEAER
jgi:hypothetical protein